MQKCTMKSVLLALSVIVKVVTIYGKKGFGPGEQDWGYVAVRADAHMFWWLYETTANVLSPIERPLVIWLQGGPGASSTGFGNFGEIGPLDLELNERNHTWVRNYNVLFIDNPVGTGFSYVTNLSALATTNKQIGKDLVVCLDDFLAKHEEFRYVPLYVAAESYGGKMTLDFALELDQRMRAGNNEANLRGISLIDSWISPIDSVLNWAPFLLNIGAIDESGFRHIDAGANRVKKAIEDDNFLLASKQWAQTEEIIDSVTRKIDFYNVLKKISVAHAKSVKSDEETKSAEDDQLDTLMNEKVRQALNIKNITFGSQASKVFSTLSGDFMRPVTDKVEKILHNTNITVQVVTGQLDLIVDTPGTVQWVDRLIFPKTKLKKSWQETPRNMLEVDGIIEGYYKTHGRFSLYWVLRAGHMVPSDNPGAMDVIMEHLVNHR